MSNQSTINTIESPTMKRLLLIPMLLFGFFTFGQITVAPTAGYLYVKGKVKFEGNEIEKDRDGLYVGAAVQFQLSEKVAFQPEALYAAYKDYAVLMLPLVFKYKIIQGLNIQAGPQIDYSVKEYPIDDVLGFADDFGFDISEDDFTRLGISAALGLGYDINERIFIESRYTFQLNDVYTGDLDISIKGNILNVGVGYRF
ncbi:porin family protein [Aegicerativicinus sediminis]|uniref:porin family protein n=1 Tax=Aegicerativicinus sediminis TaxID=2893202 RepID=UPI001E2DBBAD|nr:porin family protein [Aegicerativicinus sediminis]